MAVVSTGPDRRVFTDVFASACRQQNLGVLEFLTACCQGRLDGSDDPALLPGESGIRGGCLTKRGARPGSKLAACRRPPRGHTPFMPVRIGLCSSVGLFWFYGAKKVDSQLRLW